MKVNGHKLVLYVLPGAVMTGMLPMVSLLLSLSFSRHTKGECELEKNAEKNHSVPEGR